MTKINKLVIHGFKSFAQKTELLFGETVNCVLGPNGNGKSNILDALCFVLGRASSKSLRAEKTAHLIFDGGKKKRPAERGEVHIYFDNAKKVFPVETAEVKVSRIIRKNGQSKYRINDKTYTRTQVLDLLSAARIDPNGYNIILQGDITRFVEMSSIERRKIVEEISGISIYEERKHKALLELDKVDKKLNDADIILSERKTHLKELKKDRDQALKFKELKDRVDSNRATYLHLQLNRKNDSKDKLEKNVSQLKEKLTKIDDQIGTHKTDIQKNKDEMQKLNQEIEQKGEVEQVKLSKEIENMRVSLEKQKARVVMVKDALSKIKQRKQALARDVKGIEKNIGDLKEKRVKLEKKLSDKERELKSVEEKIAAFKKKNKIDTLGGIETEIEAVDKEVEEKQETIQKVRLEQQELFREKDKIEFQIQTFDEQLKKVALIEKENKKQIDELKQKKAAFERATLELNRVLDRDSKISIDIATARKKVHALEGEKAKLEAQNVSAQERIGGDIAVKRILALKQKKSGVYGTIAELGKVNKKYSLALELAAGQRLMSIVVEDDKTAAQCIKYLRDNKFGVATFIPLNKIRVPTIRPEAQSLLKQRGVHDFCVNLIKYDARFKKAFMHVFSDTLVVDDLDAARRIGVGKARMVTLQGDLADHSGVMRGGYHHRKKIASFVDSGVDEKLAQVESELSMYITRQNNLINEKSSNEKQIQLLRKEKLELESDVVRLEKSLHLGSGELDSTRKQKSDLQDRLKEIDSQLQKVSQVVRDGNKSLVQLKSKKEQLKLKVSQLRNPRLLAELTAFDEARQQMRDEVSTIRNDLNACDMQMKNMLAPERERIEQIVKGHDKEAESFTKELEELDTQIKNDGDDLKEKEKVQRQFFSAYKDLFHKRDQLNTKVTAAESKVDALRDQSRNIEIDMNNRSLKLAAIKSEAAGLQMQLDKLTDAKILRGKTEEELKLEITRFEKMLSTMSAVNMKALEIYESVESEYKKLIEKKETLLTEKQDVVGLMQEIEGKKIKQFMKTFNEINSNFQDKFSSLTKKGKAHLHLEDQNKPFDGGMGIRIKISGQRYMDIRSLSGGEKTMTALAFYFAVQEHEPHSFYLMDEVDAALDKHNSERLASLIRQYCKTAQYIVISHNDALISESDYLYGVSMDDIGVSKVVSLKV